MSAPRDDASAVLPASALAFWRAICRKNGSSSTSATVKITTAVMKPLALSSMSSRNAFATSSATALAMS